MAAFELRNENNPERGEVFSGHCQDLDSRRLREECIIALKVYDSCRQPRCNGIQHYYVRYCKQPYVIV